MAEMLTITSANAIYMVTIPDVYPTPQRLEGFGVDEAFDTEATDLAEIHLGVDGLTAAGWLPRLTPHTITLEANSPSFRIFEDWVAAQDAAREILYASTGLVEFPALKRKYTFRKGTLSRAPTHSGARRVLQARQFVITWAHGITPADMA